MKIKQKYILCDFDCVIIDSNLIRTNGFRYIFRKFDSNKVDQIINYHNKNNFELGQRCAYEDIKCGNYPPFENYEFKIRRRIVSTFFTYISIK